LGSLRARSNLMSSPNEEQRIVFSQITAALNRQVL
jgi:hypothetical protein